MNGYAARFVYQGPACLLKQQVILVGEDGRIDSLLPFTEEGAATRYYNGIILPAFQLPDKIEPTTPEAAFDWLRHIQQAYPTLSLLACLASFVTVPSLIPGKFVRLWCLEDMDYQTMRLEEESVLFAVYP